MTKLPVSLNDDKCNKLPSSEIMNRLFIKLNQHDKVGNYFLKLYLKENGHFLSRNISLSNSCHEIILSKMSNEYQFCKVLEFWDNLAIFLNILLDVLYIYVNVY